LIEAGDRGQVEREIARIANLNQVLISVGYQEFLFEDMAEETIRLLQEICDKIGSREMAMDALTKRFNNRECSNAIIYHLRLLAGSWLKGDPAPYEPFVQDFGVAGYCSDVIEKVDREIEHVGIMLLYNALLKPVNITLEIAYLDRSPGTQVNVYRFPDGASGEPTSPLSPVIYLLYRPDHYDILYKGLNIQVNRVEVFSHHPHIGQQQPLAAYSSVDYESLSILPGYLTSTTTGLSALGSPTEPRPSAPPQPVMGATEQYVSGSPQVPWVQTPFTHPMTPQPQPMATPAPTALAPPAPPPQPPHGEAATSSPTTTYTLRFTPQYYQLDNSVFPEPNFTTTMFKNSHFNKAHYNNPDFHPEEWTPDDDAPEKGPGGKKKARAKHE
jgi:ubiquitin thioesterase protein OTUB1